VSDERFAHLGEVAISRRDDRWLALGTDIVAFGADTDDEWKRLEVEAELLRRWRAAGVPVPRVISADPDRRLQLRERLDGITGEAVEPLLFGIAAESSIAHGMPDGRLRLDETCPLSPFGARLAESYGELCARMHAALSLDDARAFGIGEKPHMDLDAALVRLAESPIERGHVERAVRARRWIAEPSPITVVVHGDLHFHNMCLAADGTIMGVFDVGDAHLDGPATELHYVHSLGPRFVAGVLDAYGAPVDIERVKRAHVRTAIDHLQFVPPSAERYPSIIRWIAAVIEHLVPA
jgi:aminoglycoside phosphotransferase